MIETYLVFGDWWDNPIYEDNSKEDFIQEQYTDIVGSLKKIAQVDLNSIFWAIHDHFIDFNLDHTVFPVYSMVVQHINEVFERNSDILDPPKVTTMYDIIDMIIQAQKKVLTEDLFH